MRGGKLGVCPAAASIPCLRPHPKSFSLKVAGYHSIAALIALHRLVLKEASREECSAEIGLEGGEARKERGLG